MSQISSAILLTTLTIKQEHRRSRTRTTDSDVYIENVIVTCTSNMHMHGAKPLQQACALRSYILHTRRHWPQSWCQAVDLLDLEPMVHAVAIASEIIQAPSSLPTT